MVVIGIILIAAVLGVGTLSALHTLPERLAAQVAEAAPEIVAVLFSLALFTRPPVWASGCYLL